MGGGASNEKVGGLDAYATTADGIFQSVQFDSYSQAARPRQEAERRGCVEGHLAWMPNEVQWARDGPSQRPSEQHRSAGSLSAAKTRMPGGAFFCLLLFAQTNAAERSNSRRLARRANEVSQEK